MVNVYVFDIGSIYFHGKRKFRNFTHHQKYRRSHNETDVWRIWKVDSWTIRWDLWCEYNWEDSSWKYLSLVGDEEITSLLHTKFSDSVLCLGKMNENPQSNYEWEDRLTWFKNSPEYRALDNIDVEPMEFEWKIFSRFTILQLVREVQELLSRLSVQPENFTGWIIFMSMFNDISWGSKDNEKECESSAQLVSPYAKRFSPGQWSFFGPGFEKKWYSTHEYNP